jgi:N-ethylmaleimide reductase
MPVSASLFDPFRLGDLVLPNRLVMAPMTRSRAEPGGLPSRFAAQYYGQRAGAGLIVSEPSAVNREAMGYPRTPGLYAPEQIAAWKVVTDAVHAKGGRIFAQIWHTGRIGHPQGNPFGLDPVGPSALAAKGKIFTDAGLLPHPVPKTMSADDIARTIADFAQAAANALKGGFDGIEIHAANGYLFDQFFCEAVNLRTDRYGGGQANRLRFLWEVLEAIKEAIPIGRVGVRLSPYGTYNDIAHADPKGLIEALIDGLDRAAVAYVHLIEPEVSGDREAKLAEAPPPIRQWARARLSRPLIVVGGYDRARAQAVLSAGEADLIAFGRHYISNPDLAERLRSDLPLTPPNRATFYSQGPEGYIDYPAAS